LTAFLFGCAFPSEGESFNRPGLTSPTATRSAERMDEDAFWAVVEAARRHGNGDADAMAGYLEARFYDAHDRTIIDFHSHLVAANRRLYTWPHGEAADLICGYLGDDGFTDWRSWVISLGRHTFEQVAADPDNVADVEDLEGGCALAAELFGSAVGGIYYERHGYDDSELPTLEPAEDPSGEKPTGPDAVRAALPKLSRRT
jgi:hypothetical protein